MCLYLCARAWVKGRISWFPRYVQICCEFMFIWILIPIYIYIYIYIYIPNYIYVQNIYFFIYMFQTSRRHYDCLHTTLLRVRRSSVRTLKFHIQIKQLRIQVMMRWLLYDKAHTHARTHTHTLYSCLPYVHYVRCNAMGILRVCVRSVAAR